MRPPCTRTPGLLQRGFLAFLATTATVASSASASTRVALGSAATRRDLSTAGGSFSRAVES